MPIMTVTLNPAIDQTIILDQLSPGRMHKAQSVHYNIGGKAINVASCLADWNIPVTATGLLGRDNASFFEKAFAQKHIEDRFIRVPGNNRTNIKVVDATSTTDINTPGIRATESTLQKLANIIENFHGTLVLAGSLPLDCPADYFQKILVQHLSSKQRIILDTNGPALSSILSGKHMPYCIKPNIDELSEWSGHPVRTRDEALNLGNILLDKGISLVVISMGEEGAFFLSHQNKLHACLMAPKVISTVGAGDAMVAGILATLKQNEDLEQIARQATAFAVGKLGVLGPNLPNKPLINELTRKVEIRPL